MTDLNFNVVLSPYILSSCPGTLALGIQPGRIDKSHQRDLMTDLNIIRSHFNLIICLQEEFEFALHGVHNYFQTCEELNLPILHIPIQDRKAPTFEVSKKLAAYIFSLLQSGYSIYMHCLGGIGRSGCLAACVAMHYGIKKEEVIQFIRCRRSRAVQTKSQKDLVERYGLMFEK